MKDTFLENKEMTEKKPKKKRKRRKKRYLLKFILLVAFGTGVYYFLTSPLFDIQNYGNRQSSLYNAAGDFHRRSKGRCQSFQSAYYRNEGQVVK